MVKLFTWLSVLQAELYSVRSEKRTLKRNVQRLQRAHAAAIYEINTLKQQLSHSQDSVADAGSNLLGSREESEGVNGSFAHSSTELPMDVLPSTPSNESRLGLNSCMSLIDKYTPQVRPNQPQYTLNSSHQVGKLRGLDLYRDLITKNSCCRPT